MNFPKVKKSLGSLRESITVIDTISTELDVNVDLNNEERAEIENAVGRQREAVIEAENALTGFTGIAVGLFPMTSRARNAHQSAAAAVAGSDVLVNTWTSVSEEARKRETERRNAMLAYIEKPLYTVKDDEFTYHPVPSPDELGFPSSRSAQQTQVGPYHTPGPAHSTRTLQMSRSVSDSETEAPYYRHAPTSHNESNTAARGGYSNPTYNQRVSTSHGRQRSLSTGSQAPTWNYTTGRDGRQHRANPSVGSNRSVPPRPPSAALSLLPLPPPPRRRRQEVINTVETADALPSSSYQRSSGRDSIGTVVSMRSDDSFATGQRFHWDDKPIMLRDSVIEGQRLYNEWIEENNGSENVDEESEDN